MTDAPRDEQWMALSARILMGAIAAEQGRTIEAAAIARAARDHAMELAEDRIALMADTLYRSVSEAPSPQSVDYESLPWGVRLGRAAPGRARPHGCRRLPAGCRHGRRHHRPGRQHPAGP